MFWDGSKSMIILKVSHKLAKANQEKMRETTLYCKIVINNNPGRRLVVPSLGYGKKTCVSDRVQICKVWKSEREHTNVIELVERIIWTKSYVPLRLQKNHWANAYVDLSIPRHIPARQSRPCLVVHMLASIYPQPSQLARNKVYGPQLITKSVNTFTKERNKCT